MSQLSDEELIVGFAALSESTVERMLESVKAHRTYLGHKIIWACQIPPLGWFGRMKRLEAKYDVVNDEVRHLTHLLAVGRAQALQGNSHGE